MLIQSGGYITVVPDTTPTATITASGGGTTRPERVVMPYDTAVDSRATTVDLLDDTTLVVVNSGRPRNGTLTLLYSSDALALAALQLHQRRGTLTLVHATRPIVNMTYVSMGATLQLDRTTRAWTLAVRYQEVRP